MGKVAHVSCRPAGLRDTVVDMPNQTQRFADSSPGGLGLAAHQDSVLSNYQQSGRLQSFSATGIPGWLQTADYARAMLGSIRRARGESEADVEAAVTSRRRREELLRDGGRQVHSVISQAGLRYVVGGDPSVLTAALTHVREALDWPTARLGVMPSFNYGPNLHPLGTFYILDGNRVMLETDIDSTTVTEPEDVAMYERYFDAVAALAVYGDEAKAMVDGVISSL